ncbi:MAG: fibrobacter succinogenes major paralogous domain-containing protein [Fibromonadaceae bacterium]|jgi:uncharacterized protein (TIGR02145 family)|nr:fibrobacter succinogenes major paralogous domain-containing protein [Fibromonadaceae bacterium]
MNDTFTDSRDGRVYKTAKIGEQTWMAENLAYAEEGSKFYNDEDANGEKYGRLYDFEAAKKACPAGWHLPSAAEWQKLVDFVNGDDEGDEFAGERLKAKKEWNKDKNTLGDKLGTDDYNFAALPGGTCKSDGTFEGIGEHGVWWSSTEYDESQSYNWFIYYDYGDVYRHTNEKKMLCSVRCVEDKV